MEWFAIVPLVFFFIGLMIVTATAIHNANKD